MNKNKKSRPSNNLKKNKILLATLIPCLTAGMVVGTGLIVYHCTSKQEKSETPYFTTHVTYDTLKDDETGVAIIKIDLYNGMKFNELVFDDNNWGFNDTRDNVDQTFRVTGTGKVNHPGDYDVKIVGDNHSQVVGIHVESSSTPTPTLSATVEGSLKIGNSSKTAKIIVTGTNGADTSSLTPSGYAANNLTIGAFTSGEAIVSLGSSPVAGNYSITITNAAQQSTTCQVTIEQQDATPTKLVIDGVNNQSITIHTTFNLKGTYQFYCHDDVGGNPTNVKWTKTPSSLITINETSGLLSWPNNLDPDATNDFVLTCSNGSLTDAVCNVFVVIDQIPGNDICPNSWFDITAGGELSLKTGEDKNNIRHLVIPSKLNDITVTSIADNAFQGCLYLSSLTLPNTLTSIGLKAFDKCSSIISLALTQDSSIVTPTYKLVNGDTGAFVIDGSLQNNAFLVKTTDAQAGKIACTTNKDLAGNNGSGIATKTLTIPSTIGSTAITTIDGSAFNDCSNIVSLTIGSGLQIVGGDAFRLCSSLEYIDLGSIASLGEDAFAYCPKIREFIYTRNSVASDDDDLVVVDKDGNFIYNGKADLINGGFITEYKYSYASYYGYDSRVGLDCPSKLAFGSITLPTVAKYISNLVPIEGYGAFRNALSIHSVIIPNTVIEINNNTFENCTSLSSVFFSPGSSLTTIRFSAFERCTALTTITLPDSLETLGGSATDNNLNVFGDCTSLVSINIPTNLAAHRIAIHAFNGCTKLKLITVAFDSQPSGSVSYAAFDGVSPTGNIENKGSWDKPDCLAWFISKGLPNAWSIS